MNIRADPGHEQINHAISILDIGLKRIDEQFSQMMLYEAETLVGNNVEALHVMRVASRRLRVAINVFSKGLDTPIPNEIRNYLRETGHKLGAVRDFDVLIQTIEAELTTISPDNISVLPFLLNFCESERALCRRDMVEYLNSEPYCQFKDFFTSLCAKQATRMESTANQTDPKSYARTAIRKKQRTLLSPDHLSHETPIKMLHQLRIAVKKLRYTVEFFMEPLFPGLGEYLECLKTIQDQLGAIHDINFLILLGDKFTHTKYLVDTHQKIEMDFNLVILDQYLKQKRKTLEVMIDHFLNEYENSHLERRDY